MARIDPTHEIHEDHVIDIVVQVEARGIDVDALVARITLPGVEILRTSSRGMIWPTSLVTASTEAQAIAVVRDAVLGQVPVDRVLVSTVITSAPLGDLYARLDEVLDDEHLARIDLRDLVEHTLWSARDVARIREVHTPHSHSA